MPNKTLEEMKVLAAELLATDLDLDIPLNTCPICGCEKESNQDG